MPFTPADKVENLYAVSVNYLRHMLNLGESWGVSPQVLLNDSGICARQLESGQALVSVRQVGRIAKRLIRLSGRQDLGLAYGQLMRPTSHGFIGYAMMSCANYYEVLKILQKYQILYLNDFVLHFEVSENEVIFTVTEAYDFGSMRQVFFEHFLVSTCQQSAFLLGRHVGEWSVEVDWAEPDYFAAYRDRVPAWTFGQAEVRLRFPKHFLRLPVLTADPVAAQQVLAQVEKEAAERPQQTSDLPTLIKEILEAAENGFPGLPEVARQLLMSERTVVRRLAEAGTSFRSLLDEARCRRAAALIQHGQLSLAKIALQLGYTDPAAFTRAFKRWTGKCPSELRTKSPDRVNADD